MEGDLGPEEIRTREFEVVRRGYARAEVNQFRGEVADRLAAVDLDLSTLRERLSQAGMDDVPDLKSELDAVSTQVAEVLESARAAAEGMRSRASIDAARWRADADAEARSLRSTSTKDAEQARRDAWETGTELLQQADAENKKILENAHRDALFLRAEAEREALRLSGDARRDKEEALRQAKTAADRLLIEARAESERIREAARQSAQNAQERARALEQRRSELMRELESARLSIGQLEQEIDNRREALQAAAEAPEAGVRVIKSGSEPQPGWIDDASVRVVPAARVAVEEPVDADAFVAEVEELRSTRADKGRTEPVEAALEAEETDPEKSAAAEEEPSGDDEPVAAEDEEQQETPDVEAKEEKEEGEAVDGLGDGDTEPAGPRAEAPVTAAVPEGIDDLFAELRTTEEHEDSRDARASVPKDAVSRATKVVEAVTDEPTPVVTAASATPVALSTDPFELRDRLLLPVENRTLRSVKRRIVDLQNRVLEELRVGGEDWEPDRSMFTAAVADDVGRMNQESFVAGYAGAAELLGEAATPPPDRPAEQETSGEFVTALIESVTDALKRARRSGGGSRQVSAAVGRVFRAWRTDEAARRLRYAGYLAYNKGLLGSYPGLGVERVMAVAPGTPCGDCPAGTEATWAPDAKVPRGVKLPPAGPACRATIVPSA